jgi:Domain of unknown function (DUF222)/HNH endonuclease
MSADTIELELAAIRSNTTGHGLRTNLALLDRCLASIVRDLSVFDQSGEWAIDGYKSLNSWLCHETRRSNGDAARMLQLMRQLRSLPVTEEAFASGELAAAQALVVTANVNDKTIQLFADAEAEMVPLLAECTVDQTGRVMKEWAGRAKATVDADSGTEPEPETDHLHFSPLMDGRFQLDGQVSGDNAKVVDEALAACLPELVEGEPILPYSQRLAAALVEMARRALQNVPSRARRSIDVTLLIDWKDYVNGGIAKYVDGTVVAPDRVKRLLCDAKITTIVQGEQKEPLWMSRTVRSATAAQWRALVARDKHCAFPGCTMKPIWCEAHHVEEYDRDDGPTDIDNMALLCSRHHTRVHSPGWSAKMEPGQYLAVTTPDGRVLRGPPRTLPYDLRDNRNATSRPYRACSARPASGATDVFGPARGGSNINRRSTIGRCRGRRPGRPNRRPHPADVRRRRCTSRRSPPLVR